MKPNILRAAAPGILAACLVQIASGQDSHWTGTGGDNLWGNPNNWNPVGVPKSVAQGLDPVNGGNVWLQPVSGVPANILVGPGDVENPGVGGAPSTLVFQNGASGNPPTMFMPAPGRIQT